MDNNQSLKNIKKEIKSMASLLIFQENLIDEITTHNDTVKPKKEKKQVAFH